MVEYSHFKLENGLNVYVHEDKDTPMAVVNIVYNVGSKDEQEDKTGFAHLFEHLMFGGSKHIENYDVPLQKVGGENNAFTSPDITNYYCTLPAENLETAFWLESDRMLSLSFDPKVLEVQRKVVIEEFKQRYLNQPYGDVWLKLRPAAYTTHPYKWATIGKEIKHIEDATMDDVRSFFNKYYIPNNAIMVVAGNVELEQVKALSKKWFEPIPAGEPYERNLPAEPRQTAYKRISTEGDVPVSMLYMAFHMPSRKEQSYYAVDLISDILGRGKSSRLHKTLVNEKHLFSSVSAYVMGSVEKGLLVVSGRIADGVRLEQGEEGVRDVLDQLINAGCQEEELNKVKNQAESSLVFGEIDLLNRAMAIAFGANIGNANTINEESENIQAVTTSDIQQWAQEVLRKDNCTTLYYQAKENGRD